MLSAPTITARVYGGLGNQCFIYATARALADRVSGSLILDPTMLVLDTTYRRSFLLPQFHIRVTSTVGERSFWRLWLRRLHVRVRRALPWRNKHWLFERQPIRFQPEIVSWRGVSATMDGYFQTERYFDDAADTIAADLLPHQARELEATSMAARITTTQEAVFLHVRSYREVPGRQDGSFALPMTYFQNAVALMRSQVPSAHFFLFSDDPVWVRERLALASNIPCTPVTPDAGAAQTKLLDFHLMTLCRHAIVANSSFSWWSAWLGERRNRRRQRAGLILRPAGPAVNAAHYPARWQEVARS